MNEMIRHCPDCGGERPFEQHHAGPRGCPDSPDAYCHEWSCTACGTGLLIGFILSRLQGEAFGSGIAAMDPLSPLLPDE